MMLGKKRIILVRVRTFTVALVALTLGILVLGGSAKPDLTVDFTRPSDGLAETVDFAIGTNEIFDLYNDGGIDRTSQIGADLVRVWVGHRFLGSAVRSNQQGHLDWELLHAFIQKVLDAGATPLVSFVSAPRWITALDGTPSSEHESETFDTTGQEAFGLYVADAIEKLRDRFGKRALKWPYQVWNEPNNHQNAGSHYACGDGKAYTDLYLATQDAVAARFGSGTVALGGPSLDAIDTGATVNVAGERLCRNVHDSDWATYMRSVDARANHDFLTWHWYGMFQIDETTAEDLMHNRLRWFEDRVFTMTQISNGRPHYIEEINLNGDLAVDPLVNEPINGAFLASATLRAIRQGANGLLVYKGTRNPSGLSPRGEADFGLWSSNLVDPPTPAFNVLRLLRRFVAGSGRLVHVSNRQPYLDAIAVESESSRRMAIVNLTPAIRTVRIAGVSPGPTVIVNGTKAWESTWFNGEILEIPGYGLAVIDDPVLGLPALPTVVRGHQTYDNKCQHCHGSIYSSERSSTLAGTNRTGIDISHASESLTKQERIDLANFLNGSNGARRAFQGTVIDTANNPVRDALVIGTGSNNGISSWTDNEGRFTLEAPDSTTHPSAGPTQFIAVHPNHGASLTPTIAISNDDRGTIKFTLRNPPTKNRPLVASAFSVLETSNIVRIGAGTAGEKLTVWAVDSNGGIAKRLKAEVNHPFGLHDAQIRAIDGPRTGRNWVLIAIAPSGEASQFLRVPNPKLQLSS